MNAAIDIPRSLSRALRSLGRTVDLDPRARRTSARRPVNVQVLFEWSSAATQGDHSVHDRDVGGRRGGRFTRPERRGRAGHGGSRGAEPPSRNDGRARGEAWALNLSSGGMRLVCEEELAVGDVLCLRIEPGDECSSGLIGHGKVVWAKKCPDGHVIGIEFVEPH